ncbi:MAG TPA: hypothetical protein VNL13_00885 [Sulfolobales archaeon]|nr:hypothetical protein [Sulfolobales archaeon]
MIGTDNGVYELSGKRLDKICCDGMSIYDLKSYEDKLYICSSNKGLARLDNEGYSDILRGSCWRLTLTDKGLVASLDGPRLYLVAGDRVELLADYRGYASKHGWWFPHGPPHITDFAIYKGVFVASVEVGNLLKGSDLASLEPLPFSHDQHNLLALEELLLIATASGVYYTEDLEVFSEAKGSHGYFHALEKCGDLVLGHVISSRPLRISRNRGRSWDKVDIELPSPTFGTTGITCIGEGKAIYASSEVYLVDLESEKAEKLVEKIPMTRRVATLDNKDL